MLSRRSFLSGATGLSWASLPRGAAAQEAVASGLNFWLLWLELERMQAHVRRRQWELDPLAVDPPATEDEIRNVEQRHGIVIPAQLRGVLLNWSARATFGWSIPDLVRPFEGLNLPSSGGLPDGLWSLEHIDKHAIAAFGNMRDGLAGRGDGEEPNRPEMWDHQFPFASLSNGDALTIDVSSAGGPQPVRYYSSELEGLHHHIIAPDFMSFLFAYARLGCAGGDQDEWFRFLTTDNGEVSYLEPDGEGGRRWRAWLARDSHDREADEPPLPVAAATRSDFNLLDAAHDGSSWGIEAALAAGAVPDCVDARMPNRDGLYDLTYETALVFAVRRSDLADGRTSAWRRRQSRYPPPVGQRGDPFRDPGDRPMAARSRRACERLEGRPSLAAARSADPAG